MKDLPVSLTIGGSDSGSGAGIQADLKTFTMLETFGTTALTCLTAQNPDSVSAIEAVSDSFLKAQLDSIFNYFPVVSAKTGMLFSKSLIEVVTKFFSNHKSVQLVVDPVMVATSGAKLLQDEAIEVLVNKLIPLAYIITPNLDEASLLLGREIKEVDELERSVKELFDKFKVPVLLKGGHIQMATSAIDILYDGHSIYRYEKPYINNRNTHGSGCTFSAAISAFLARGISLPSAVGNAKEYIHRTFEDPIQAGPNNHMNHKIPTNDLLN